MHPILKQSNSQPSSLSSPAHAPSTPTSPIPSTLSIRVDDANPNHHLWQNHGWWWIHYVVHRGNRKERIRRSLQTRDLDVARRRRDDLFARLRAAAAAAGVAA